MSIKNNTTSLQSLLSAINALPEAGGEQATPVISVNSTNGLITATAGTKSSTHQLAFQPAKTITPSTASQIAVSSGYYTGGNITVAAVPTQSKSVTPTSSAQNVTPDSGKFLSKVTVAAIPSTYVKPTTTKGATTYTPTTTNQTIAAGTYLTGVQTIKGDANLVAGNIKSGVSIFGVSGTLEEGGGSSSGELVDYSENEDAIISRTISSYFNDRVTTIGNFAFVSCASLTTISFPTCTTIGSDAFASCNKLTTISFPACTTIGSYAFYQCSALTTASFSACTSIGSAAFRMCRNLTTINLPVCKTIGSYAFCDCYKLSYVDLPACNRILSGVFGNCSNLSYVNLPVCTVVDNDAITRCNTLSLVNLPCCRSIGPRAFSGCYFLNSIILTSNAVCTLTGSNAFSSTPYVGYSNKFSGTPYIYVPASLVSAYQSATNWVYFSSYFSAINDNINVPSEYVMFIYEDWWGDAISYRITLNMTWKEFVESDYNIDGFYINESYVYDNYNMIVCDESGNSVLINEIIKNNGKYSSQ